MFGLSFGSCCLLQDLAMIWKAGLVLCLAVGVLSYNRPAISEQKITRVHHGDLKHIGHQDPEHHEIYAWAYPSYEFSYHVDDPHTHDKKGQHEIRDGDKVTGNYWLLQPDGRKRTVKYSSDHKKGFHAEVNYDPHEGHHPIDYKREDDHVTRRLSKKHEKEDVKSSERHRDHRDEKQDRENKHGRDRPSWGWIKPQIHSRDEHHDRIDISDRRHGHSHTERWRHGVLVGWNEGRDRDDRHEDRDDQDRHRDKDDYHKGEDSRHDQDDRRGQHSHYRPILSYKPLVPYGHRLH